jgi:hypothetical protein
MVMKHLHVHPTLASQYHGLSSAHFTEEKTDAYKRQEAFRMASVLDLMTLPGPYANVGILQESELGMGPNSS